MSDFYLNRVHALESQIAKALQDGDTACAARLNREAARAVRSIAARTSGLIKASWENKATAHEAEAGRLEHGKVVMVAGGTNQVDGSRPHIRDVAECATIKTLAELQLELGALVGMAPVKEEVKKLWNSVNIQRVRSQAGLRCPPFSYHCVFTGNPGTGKTTVARILAEIYRELGVLKKGHLVEADRARLVGEYQGHTATKTNALVDEALDGVLFIDEAYSLVNGENDSFGCEAVNTLLKRIEDDRSRLAVIIAGYTDEIETFIATNPGFKSRFTRFIEFPDYSGEELVEIFKRWVNCYDYTMSADTQAVLTQRLCQMRECVKDPKTFGNARDARSFFEKVVERHAVRISEACLFGEDALREIQVEDLCF